MQSTKNQQRRSYNDLQPIRKPAKEQVLNSRFILDVMKDNDTLVVKRGIDPAQYFSILSEHQKRTHCRVVRLEALGSAIPNLIRVTQLLELCDMATTCKFSCKPRRMKIGENQDLSLQKHEHVVCKFLECVKIDMEFQTSENQYPHHKMQQPTKYVQNYNKP